MTTFVHLFFCAKYKENILKLMTCATKIFS